MKIKDYPHTGQRVCTESMENGLSVIVLPTPEYNKTYAFFATDYGGADRRFKLGGKWIDTPAGVAHFLEHKMFDVEGEENALTQLSANGASPNAFTSSDITAYHFESVDSFWENLEILLKFVSIPYFTEESVAKEQGIIGQEIRMTEDDPNYSVYFGLLKLLYRDNPMRDSVAGTVESIAQITAQTLYDCHSAFYNPSNMVLVVAGDVDAARVAETARRILPDKYGLKPERDYGGDVGIKPHEKRAERVMEVGLPMFLAGWRSKPVKRDDILKRELVAGLALKIVMGRSSPLYSELYAKGLINAGFSAEYESVAGAAHCVFGGESENPDAVVKAIADETGKIISSGCDRERLGRLKRAQTGELLRGLNSFDRLCYNMARGYFRGYDPLEWPSVISEINHDDVQEFIEENLNPENLAISIIRNR